jgi:hypothetical protein
MCVGAQTRELATIKQLHITQRFRLLICLSHITAAARVCFVLPDALLVYNLPRFAQQNVVLSWRRHFSQDFETLKTSTRLYALLFCWYIYPALSGASSWVWQGQRSLQNEHKATAFLGTGSLWCRTNGNVALEYYYPQTVQDGVTLETATYSIIYYTKLVPR